MSSDKEHIAELQAQVAELEATLKERTEMLQDAWGVIATNHVTGGDPEVTRAAFLRLDKKMAAAGLIKGRIK